MYQSEVLADLSFVVVDNHREGWAAPALKALGDWVPRYRYVPFGGYHGTSVKDLVFREADAEIVCCGGLDGQKVESRSARASQRA